jgi:hypothetical protein
VNKIPLFPPLPKGDERGIFFAALAPLREKFPIRLVALRRSRMNEVLFSRPAAFLFDPFEKTVVDEVGELQVSERWVGFR